MARFESGSWPTARVVCRQFGTFNDALRAAALPTRRSAGRKANLTSSDEILVAIRAWTLRFDDPPTQTDWDPYRAERTGQQWRIDRYQSGDWPSLPTVRRHFGGLPAATRAAGLEPAPQHEAPDDRAARRRRNRLAMVDLQAAVHVWNAEMLRRSLRVASEAAAHGDSHGAERALLEVAGAALALADQVRTRRRPPDG